MTDDDRDEPAAPRPDQRRSVPATAFVVAVVAAALFGLVAVIALATGNGGDDRADDARFAAGRFAERFLTFRHDALDEWKADVLALSTGGFAGEVENVEEALRTLLAEGEIDARTQVTDIYLGEIEQGTVSAVVTYDRDIISATGTRSESDRYMQLELNLVDGEWLVDNVIDVATAGAGLPSDAEAPSPPTSEPGAEPSAPATTAGDG